MTRLRLLSPVRFLPLPTLWMKLIAAGFLVAAANCTYAGTVQLTNYTHPGTAAEPGDTLEVYIVTTPNATITLTNNGGGQTTDGTANSSGIFSGYYAQTSSTVGSYNEVWYSNGQALTAVNLSQTYFPFAPKLPAFNVWATYSGTTCPAASTSSSNATCNGHSTLPYHWPWHSVTYTSTSQYSLSDITNAAGEWNSANSKILLTTGSTNSIGITDGTPPSGYNGITYSYGQDCSSCYDKQLFCDEYSNPGTAGACLDSAAVYYVDIVLGDTSINNTIAAGGYNTDTFVTLTVAHELGHALRLGDVAPTHGACSEVKSLMYSSASALIGCGVTSPQSCDTNALNTVYPSTPLVCDPGYLTCYLSYPNCN